MDWKNWKTWSLFVAIILALVAIYAFANPTGLLQEPEIAERPRIERTDDIGELVAASPASGQSRVDLDRLTREPSSFHSDRNLFDFVRPPAPPPPKPVVERPPEPPPPPPDRDGDGIADAVDNCPDLPNPDQRDIDRDGIGTACETEKEIPPPPPLPKFDFKYLGRFGTEPNQIAVFSRGGEIVNVLEGQTFGEKFILRRIGLESVDIGYKGYAPDRTTRVKIGE
ncbi:MAG: thrombospondin type 3 repeat-containing protein [Acidobacteria bacterium]|nr:thrombospondin type 3 repeat-containing protein [Acidobacteriota bacterium]